MASSSAAKLTNNTILLKLKGSSKGCTCSCHCTNIKLLHHKNYCWIHTEWQKCTEFLSDNICLTVCLPAKVKKSTLLLEDMLVTASSRWWCFCRRSSWSLHPIQASTCLSDQVYLSSYRPQKKFITVVKPGNLNNHSAIKWNMFYSHIVICEIVTSIKVRKGRSPVYFSCITASLWKCGNWQAAAIKTQLVQIY